MIPDSGGTSVAGMYASCVLRSRRIPCRIRQSEAGTLRFWKSRRWLGIPCRESDITSKGSLGTTDNTHLLSVYYSKKVSTSASQTTSQNPHCRPMRMFSLPLTQQRYYETGLMRASGVGLGMHACILDSAPAMSRVLSMAWYTV